MCSSQSALSSADDSKRNKLYFRILPTLSVSPKLNESGDEELPNACVSSFKLNELDMTSSETKKCFMANVLRNHTRPIVRRPPPLS